MNLLQATAENGDTALHLATRRRDIDMVRILVDYGSNVDVQNGEGQTALHICAAEGDEALLKYFYGVRASAAITDNMDRTPMHVAAGSYPTEKSQSKIFFTFLLQIYGIFLFQIKFRKRACKRYRNLSG